jgi:SAM-dependent methyltransferase
METSMFTYRKTRQTYWDDVARLPADRFNLNAFYHQRLKEIYQFLVVSGHRVMEIGCGQGDMLAALQPSWGVGIDFSGEMVAIAQKRHPALNFLHCDAHEIGLKASFDVIILSDLINDLWDVQAVFEQIRHLSTARTRIIINFYSRLWELPLLATRAIGLSKKQLHQNWLTADDVAGLLDMADFQVTRLWREVLWPIKTPIISRLLNRMMVKIWPFNHLALTNFIVARPRLKPASSSKKPFVSVIVPARNEAGNIADIFARVPQMGGGTELVFVEGHSTDDTYEMIKKQMENNPLRQCILLRQKGEGKGDAVRLGFQCAGGDILMILDADLTVPPELLPRFFEVLYSGKGEFVNGVRLVYPMEKEAMRYLNLLGNKFFSLAFTWLLGQPVKDTLCGTKAMWKADYLRIAGNRSYFGDFDPFGDFDLLFGAAKLNLSMAQVPIRYRERKYGRTNIRRWHHGWLLLRMVMFAVRKIKFV